MLHRKYLLYETGCMCIENYSSLSILLDGGVWSKTKTEPDNETTIDMVVENIFRFTQFFPHKLLM